MYETSYLIDVASHLQCTILLSIRACVITFRHNICDYRRAVYQILEEQGIDLPRYAVLDRDSPSSRATQCNDFKTIYPLFNPGSDHWAKFGLHDQCEKLPTNFGITL